MTTFALRPTVARSLILLFGLSATLAVAAPQSKSPPPRQQTSPTETAGVAKIRQSAEQGDAEAQFQLGEMYADGKGVPQDFAQAIAWLRKAADQEHTQARTLLGAYSVTLGSLLFEGKGNVKQDYAAAASLFKVAAELGDRAGQYLLGFAYGGGLGVPQDDAQAAVWMHKAAAQGVKDAQSRLGEAYYNGKGVQQDYGQAAAWFRKAAEQGEVRAQYNLGLLHAQGQGVPQDYTQAAAWFRKAAEQGEVLAQYSLGLEYAQGQGVPQDYTQAVSWSRKAAEQGNADAMHNLGMFYSTGKGVPQDFVEGHKWRNLAAARTSADKQKEYADVRDALAKEMNPQQLAEAQKRASEWLAAFEGRRTQWYSATDLAPVQGPTATSAPQTTAPPARASADGSIQREINKIKSGRYAPTPTPQATPAGQNSATTMTISNETSYTLSVFLSGPASQKLQIAARGSQAITLSPGNYEIAASVSDLSVIPFYGKETFGTNTEYSERFFIATSRQR